MSPAHSHVEQSRNTLSFATRAKEVTNTAHVNMVRNLMAHEVSAKIPHGWCSKACPPEQNAKFDSIASWLLSLMDWHLNATPFSGTQQVVSDKVLVKQLQKEVARLEAELKLPEGGMESSSSEALLQAKDLQIQKVCFCLHLI